MTQSPPIRRVVLLAALALTGCEAADTAGPAPQATTTTMDIAQGAAGGPTATHMDVFLLDVPAGSISGDEAFWRTVDEQAAGAAAGQRLLANGIRCGVAQRTQWRHFAQIFSRELDRARHTKVEGLSTQTVELEVEQPVEREDVFFLNADGQLEGRSYDHATNGVAMTFGPTPREPGSVRLAFAPIVKRQERLRGFTPWGQATETPATDVDRLYDVGLTVDVPADGFFILAPAPGADRDLTLGGRFLVRREAASRREQIIVAVPKLVPLNVPPAAE